MADYAIHDTTLIGTSNIIRKKEGSSALINPADYPKRINLMGMLEEKTATGSIVTFPDGADDVPLKSCEVALPASLDGYSSVDVVSAGKNLVDLSSMVVGYVQINGQFATAHSNGEMRSDFIPVLPNTTYYFSILETTGAASDWVGVGEYTSNDVSSFVRRDSFWRFTTSATTKYIVVSSRNLEQATKIQLEIGSDPTTWEAYSPITTHTASLGRTIYGGTVDVVKGEGTDENGNDFTFSPIEISSRLGNNTMWSDGDMEVTYRASGTVTPIVPTLISKTITANGTYSASDDGADGYDAVVVNVASPEPTVTPLNSPNAFMTISGITGTDVTRVARTITAPSDGKYVFASDSTCMTNTGSGDGFIDIQKNDVSVVKQYMSANTTTAITIPDIDVEAGDEVDIVVGFDNAHSSCNFQLYTGIALVSEASAPSLLSMIPSEEVNENEEVEENEQNDIEG